MDTDVLLVSFEPIDLVRGIPDEQMGWNVVSDPERLLYRAYGLERLNFVRTWLSPRTIAYYIRAAASGRRVRIPQSDSRQLGGDFIIDPDGFVTFVHRSSEPADRPHVDRMIDVVRGRLAQPGR